MLIVLLLMADRKVVLEAFVKAAWEHENKYSALPITAGFSDFFGSSATFSNPSEGHGSTAISAGISAQLAPAISLYLTYNPSTCRPTTTQPL